MTAPAHGSPMFSPSNNPDQLGDPGGDGGGETAVLYVTPEVVPVRLVFSQPIPVMVQNWPGQPPPLPGLRGPGQPPPLPGQQKPIVPKVEGLTAEKLGLGEMMKLGTVAGVAAGAVGLVAAGFGELKSTFLDPIIGAAKEGFGRGVARGSGVETLSKTAEVLGVSFGVLLLPATMKLAAAALTIADIFDRAGNTRLGRYFMSAAEGLTSPLPSMLLHGDEGIVTKLTRAQESFIKGVERIPGFGGLYAKYVDATGGHPNPEKIKENESDNFKEVLNDLKNSLGSKAQFVGVANIREAAQMAASEDPLQARLKKRLLEWVDKQLGLGGGAGPGMVDARQFLDNLFRMMGVAA